MNIGELIEILQEMDPTLEVILQRDPEGNGYSPIYGVDDNCLYDEECEVFSKDDPDLEEYCDVATTKPVVVLFPMY